MVQRPVRILLIDDDEDDYLLTRDLLGDIPNGGFVLDWVADYDQGLEALRRGDHDVFLLDYRLGRRTGLDLLRDAARPREGDSSPRLPFSAPVILLTGQGEREVDVAAMEAGAADFLVKSRLDSATLDRAIRYTLLQKRQADELERKVSERTAELARANASLQAEVGERKRVERALRESEARFRHLAESMPQIVWVIAADGTLEYLNRQWTEITGLTLEQTRDLKRLEQAIHPEDVPGLLARFEQAAERCTSYQAEFRLRRASDGAYRWFLGRGVPVLDESGTILRWYGTSTDINDQKLIQDKLRDSDRRKDEFLATLAHELRNPLAPIRNALEIMRLAGTDPASMERGRAMIARQVQQLVRLIDDLLDISRITRGKVNLRKERIDAASVVQSALETAQPLIEQAGHTLTVELPPAPVSVDADPTRLAQVLVNLLNNAAKYTDPGGQVRLIVEPKPGRVLFRVRDTGIGIAPEMLSRIFEMFTQMGRAEERSQGGLGIGLSLVRGLVELHGGSVEAHSEGPGRGSEFMVSLPRPGG